MSDDKWTVDRGHYNDGTPKYENHYIDGLLHDLPDGTAAEREWNPDGSLKYEYHYRNGVLVEAQEETK